MKRRERCCNPLPPPFTQQNKFFRCLHLKMFCDPEMYNRFGNLAKKLYFYFRDFTDTLQQLYHMISLVKSQDDMNHIKLQIEHVLQGQMQQSQPQQPYAWTFPGEGNTKW